MIDDTAKPLSDVMVALLQRLERAGGAANIAPVERMTARALVRRGFAYIANPGRLRLTDNGRAALMTHERITGAQTA